MVDSSALLPLCTDLFADPAVACPAPPRQSSQLHITTDKKPDHLKTPPELESGLVPISPTPGIHLVIWISGPRHGTLPIGELQVHMSAERCGLDRHLLGIVHIVSLCELRLVPLRPHLRVLPFASGLKANHLFLVPAGCSRPNITLSSLCLAMKSATNPKKIILQESTSSFWTTLEVIRLGAYHVLVLCAHRSRAPHHSSLPP